MIERLLDTFSPENYELTLTIDKKRKTFEGEVKITGNLQKISTVLKLHAKDLNIKTASIDKFEIDSIMKSKHDVIELISSKRLAKGVHTLQLSFNGKITEPMHGMYPCNFEHDGKKKQLIATQFESHHAREVFPCVDEPAAKATFDLTLVTQAKEVVLANTPI
jgi:aminopeptidase N